MQCHSWDSYSSLNVLYKTLSLASILANSGMKPLLTDKQNQAVMPSAMTEGVKILLD